MRLKSRAYMLQSVWTILANWNIWTASQRTRYVPENQPRINTREKGKESTGEKESYRLQADTRGMFTNTVPLGPQLPSADLGHRLICPDCKSVPNIVEDFSAGDYICGDCGLYCSCFLTNLLATIKNHQITSISIKF